MRTSILRRYSWLLVLLLGGGLFKLDEQTLVHTGDPNYVPSVVLIGAAVVPIAFVAFVYGRRLPYDVPTSVVVATALVGGIIGTVVAGIWEFETLRRFGFLPTVGIAVIEELSKLLTPLLILIVLPYRRTADGLLLGVASGAGFAALETMGYAFVVLLRSGGNIGATAHLLFLRGVLSPAAHMAWTGITAAALFACWEERWRFRSIIRFVVVLGIAITLHALWDSVGNLHDYVFLAGAGLVVLGWVTHRAARDVPPLDAYADPEVRAGRRGLVRPA
jgi:RsiW-degrading membrane proteinase PrsW (M82 family)